MTDIDKRALALRWADWLDTRAEGAFSVEPLTARGREEARALAALLRESVEGWNLDMGAAPRDGTEIDLWAHFPEHNVKRRVPGAKWMAEHDDWQIGAFRAKQLLYPPEILAWRSLPAPPAEEGK